MAQQANIAVYDGATVPVLRTFTAEGIERPDPTTQLASWREVSLTIPIGAQATVSEKKQKLKSGVVVATLEVKVPVQETPTGGTPEGYSAPPKVAFEDRVLVIHYQHPRSSTTSRRLVRQLALNIAGNVGTSVVAATSGPWPDLADNSLMPT